MKPGDPSAPKNPLYRKMSTSEYKSRRGPELPRDIREENHSQERHPEVSSPQWGGVEKVP